jgi:hypothetical protein
MFSVDLRKNEMNREEWGILDQVLEFLEEFATITKCIEGSGHPTLSPVVSMYNRLLTILEDVSQNLHQSISYTVIVKGAAAGLEKLSACCAKHPLLLWLRLSWTQD